ncbi:MAG: DUF4143 domain-containing protein [Saprospiraceae bacterium]|nr:DUF4143 domain-containing protein [Saprospiraceae bacterium]
MIEERGQLRHRLIFGAYPEVVTTPAMARETLAYIAGDYLYKDLFRLEQIKKNRSIGKYRAGLSPATRRRSILSRTGPSGRRVATDRGDLLEKAFIVFRLPAFSRNLRNEIEKGRKIYFWDNGIRNAVLGNFSHIETRTDAGALWENYMVAKRLKLHHYARTFARAYFWRTTEQQEVDYIEELDGQLTAFEFKWNPTGRAKLPKALGQKYPIRAFHIVTPENYDLYLTAEALTREGEEAWSKSSLRRCRDASMPPHLLSGSDQNS